MHDLSVQVISKEQKNACFHNVSSKCDNFSAENNIKYEIIAHYSLTNKMKSCPTLFPSERFVSLRKYVIFCKLNAIFFSYFVLVAQSEEFSTYVSQHRVLEGKLSLTNMSKPIFTHFCHMTNIHFREQRILMSWIKLLSNLINIHGDEGELAVLCRPDNIKVSSFRRHVNN